MSHHHDHFEHHRGEAHTEPQESPFDRLRRFRPPFPGGFGGGFGPGGFGPGHGFGPGGRRGGPRARRGDIRSAILGLLAQAPSNGYGLIRAIGERTEGAWTPSPGSIYPTLAQLVDEELVVQPDGSRGAYELTDAGREHVAAHAEEIEAAFESARGAGGDSLMEAFGKLVHAAGGFRGEVTPEQRAAAVTAIDTARRELHRILAE